MSTTELYERDFIAWTEKQAGELRALRTSRWNGPLDLEHLAEEIEDLGRSQRHARDSLLEQIFIHLLKLRCAKGGVVSELVVENRIKAYPFEAAWSRCCVMGLVSAA